MEISRTILGAIASLAFASTGAVVAPEAIAQVTSTAVSAGEATIQGTINFAAPEFVQFTLPTQLVEIDEAALQEGNVFIVEAPVTNSGNSDASIATTFDGALPPYLTATLPADTIVAVGATETLQIEFTVGVIPQGTATATVGVILTGTSGAPPNPGPFTF